jgi:hypothetical protein
VTGDLLDLVRRYGVECLAQGAAAQRGSAPDQFHAKQAARSLLARIAAAIDEVAGERDAARAEIETQAARFLEAVNTLNAKLYWAQSDLAHARSAGESYRRQRDEARAELATEVQAHRATQLANPNPIEETTP